MTIKFSMDGIKNMDLLYTWTPCENETFGAGTEEHYHGCDYCISILDDTFVPFDGWHYEYIGTIERVGNEVFRVLTSNGKEYEASFTINTYEQKIARLECTIICPDDDEYDQDAEKLKIALKDRLLNDWDVCTWLADDQSVSLCKTAYEKASVIENNLRAFASKVLIHFLGNNWIKRAGLDHIDESVTALKTSFSQRVPEFDNINTDFLSMTLETLAKVIFDGKIYAEDIVLSRQDYKTIQEIGAKGKTLASNVADFVKGKRKIEKDIWQDLFTPYMYNPESFKKAMTDFIAGRNHVAHSKVISWRAYQIMISDFERMDSEIDRADTYFEEAETAEEVFATIAAEEQADNDEYYRERLAAETGLDILSEPEIQSWFDSVLHGLYTELYQRYHFDSRFEMSDYYGISDHDQCFSIRRVDDETQGIIVVAASIIDDELGSDSNCTAICTDTNENELCTATIIYHNGNGVENEEGIMEPTEDTVYDDSEIKEFQKQIIDYLEN